MTRSRTHRASQRSTGFTMIELIIVISIIAIGAVVVQPSLEPSEPYAVELATSQWVDAIERARLEALRMDARYGVTLEPATGRIRVFRSDPTSAPNLPIYDVAHPITKRAYDIRLDDHSATANVTVTATTSFSAACSQPALILFDGDGTPRCGNPEGVLLASGSLTLSQGAHSRTIQIQGGTGRVIAP